VGLTYVVYVGARAPSASPTRRFFTERDERFRQRYTQLPANLSPRVRELAETITRGEPTALGKARALERYLSSHYRYTLNLESGGAESPLDDFLFRSRAGHCEYFSTAMAVMLRTMGVPSRNVTGFLGGTYNRYGRFYEVHQGDSHSWVEAWDPQQGWVTFDPTPAVGEVPLYRRGVLAEVDAMIEAARVRWRRYIVDFDLKDQTRIAQEVWQYYVTHRRPRASVASASHARRATSAGDLPVKRLAAGAVILGALVALAMQLRQWRAHGGGGSATPRTPSVRAAQELARALDDALSQRGTSRPSSRSPLAFAKELSRRGDAFAPVALRVANRYMSARYGDETLTARELDGLRAELRAAAQPTPKETVAQS
jgi:hypothetical protein